MNNETSKPITRSKDALLRIAKRAEMSNRNTTLLRIAAVLAAICAGGLFVLALGYNPFQIYAAIINGAFRSAEALRATIKLAIPLLIAALGISIAFRMRFWNIGAEGQIIMGAIFASYFALFHSSWPKPLLVIIMLLAGILGGAFWGAIPALFKAKWGTNETLFTLMLNYIALYIIAFLRDGPWADPESLGFPKIARFSQNAQLYQIGKIQIGWIIGLILTVLVYIYMKYTKQGYQIRVVGESTATAHYAGMPVNKIIIRTMLLSGGICGIAGMTQATGSDMTLASSVAGGVGFTAIIVAWLARLNPFGILLVTVLFSILEKGCSVMQSSFGLSSYASDVLQGIILFFVLAGEFLIRYRFVLRRKEGKV